MYCHDADGAGVPWSCSTPQPPRECPWTPPQISLPGAVFRDVGPRLEIGGIHARTGKGDWSDRVCDVLITPEQAASAGTRARCWR